VSNLKRKCSKFLLLKTEEQIFLIRKTELIALPVTLNPFIINLTYFSLKTTQTSGEF